MNMGNDSMGSPKSCRWTRPPGSRVQAQHTRHAQTDQLDGCAESGISAGRNETIKALSGAGDWTCSPSRAYVYSRHTEDIDEPPSAKWAATSAVTLVCAIVAAPFMIVWIVVMVVWLVIGGIQLGRRTI